MRLSGSRDLGHEFEKLTRVGLGCLFESILIDLFLILSLNIKLIEN